MPVTVTLPSGRCHRYMRYGDVYVKNGDGSLDVVRMGAKATLVYARGAWTSVDGDEKKAKRRRFFG